MKELSPEEIQKLMQNMVDEFKQIANGVILAISIGDGQMVLMSGFGSMREHAFIGKSIEKMVFDKFSEALTTDRGRL